MEAEGNMPTAHDRVLTLCREVADRLRAVALDESEDLTPAERRDLVEIALEIERRLRGGEVLPPE